MIESIHEKIHKYSNKPIKTKNIGEDENYDVIINIDYNKETCKYSLIIGKFKEILLEKPIRL